MIDITRLNKRVTAYGVATRDDGRGGKHYIKKDKLLTFWAEVVDPRVRDFYGSDAISFTETLTLIIKTEVASKLTINTILVYKDHDYTITDMVDRTDFSMLKLKKISKRSYGEVV